MYNSYPSDYATFEDVELQLQPLVNEGMDSDKDAIIDAIHSASGMVNHMCHRTFVPYIDTAQEVLYCLSPYRIQELPDNALVVNSILDTNGNTVTASTYRLRDRYNTLHLLPYGFVEFTSNANIATVDSDGFAPTFSIDGIWGYSEAKYANAWSEVTALNDASGIDDNSTTVSVIVDDASAIGILSYIRLGTEFMQVTDKTANTLTVKRAVNGSTIATHADNTEVYLWTVDEPVKLATTRLASWLYSSRKTDGQTVQFFDGTIAGVNFPQIVKVSLAHYIKPIALTVQ